MKITIDNLVRDFTKVHSMPKSEVRKRIKKLLEQFAKEFEFGGKFFHGDNHNRLPIIRELRKEITNYIKDL